MPSSICSVLSPQANRVPGQRDLGSHSNTERLFTTCLSLLSIGVMSCFSISQGWSGLTVYKHPCVPSACSGREAGAGYPRALKDFLSS